MVKLPTLGEAIDAYIDKRDAVLSPSTIRGYREIRRARFTEWMDAPLDSIPYQAMVNAEAKMCSAKMLKNAWMFVASVLRENGVLPPKVQLPQVVVKDRPFLEPEQIRPFIDAVHDTDVEIPALLVLSSLRRSELLGLDWSNVDLERKVIHIRGAAIVLNENNKTVRKETNKNTTSNRDVPILIPELFTALEKAWQPSGPVVQYYPNSIGRAINKVCAQRGLPLVSVHGLRHSFVSLCYRLNVPEKVVMEIGGWADFQTMRKIYTHIAKSDVNHYIDTIKEFFANENANATR